MFRTQLSGLDNIQFPWDKNFNTIMNTKKNNYDSILNYFEKRNKNAAVDSFNHKIKAFRNKFRGVRDLKSKPAATSNLPVLDLIKKKKKT